MDAESKTSDRDGSRLSDPPTDGDGDSSGDGNTDAASQPTEWLATARQRRSTAGNRMKSMLANEEPDSDLELLFAEDDDDQGFSDVEEGASDVQMDSSSSDDDDDDGDGLEGEDELERQARERRAAQRKRKAHEAVPAKFRKRVRIDPTTPAPAPRPKKKSERTSWLPSPADLPTRASSRHTTRISKEQLHQQMVEREARRLRQLAQMQKKAARLEAMKKPPMTQEQRLAEAAAVEKRNSKSLNRWEEAEKQREEDRRARLAALNNRTLEGPVITFWSGVRQWKDALGQHVTMVEAKPKKKRDKGPKAANKAAADRTPTPEAAEKTPAAVVPKPDPDGRPPTGEPSPTTASSRSPGGDHGQQDAPMEQAATTATARTAPEQHEARRLMAMPPSPPSSAPPSSHLAAPARAPQPPSHGPLATPSAMSRPRDPRPSAVLAAPVLAPPPGIMGVADAPKSNVLAPPNTSQQQPPPPLHSPQHRETPLQPPQDRAAPASKPPTPGPAGAPLPSPPSPSRISTTTTARNAIIYRNFNENAIRDKAVQTQILFGRRMSKLSKPTPAPHCAITDHPARYRDPQTGLPFHNAIAYREIQRLHRGDYRWSRLLGAWVGSGTYAARGVPLRFLGPDLDEDRPTRPHDGDKDTREERDKAPRKEPEPPAAEAAPAAPGETYGAGEPESPARSAQQTPVAAR